ncbi:hypothetical protein ACHAPI_012161 [Fusarium lateritium]
MASSASFEGSRVFEIISNLPESQDAQLPRAMRGISRGIGIYLGLSESLTDPATFATSDDAPLSSKTLRIQLEDPSSLAFLPSVARLTNTYAQQGTQLNLEIAHHEQMINQHSQELDHHQNLLQEKKDELNKVQRREHAGTLMGSVIGSGQTSRSRQAFIQRLTEEERAKKEEIERLRAELGALKERLREEDGSDKQRRRNYCDELMADYSEGELLATLNYTQAEEEQGSGLGDGDVDIADAA